MWRLKRILHTLPERKAEVAACLMLPLAALWKFWLSEKRDEWIRQLADMKLTLDLLLVVMIVLGITAVFLSLNAQRKKVVRTFFKQLSEDDRTLFRRLMEGPVKEPMAGIEAGIAAASLKKMGVAYSADGWLVLRPEYARGVPKKG